MFVLFGAGGLLWLAPWLHAASRVPAARPNFAPAGPGIAAVLRRRQAWGTFTGHFFLNYTWYFVLSWLPSYLTRERHYSTEAMALWGALPFWGMAVTCALFGVISDRMIARGMSPTRVRIGFVAGGMLLSTLMLPACLIRNQAVSMALLTVGCLSLGLVSANFAAITQTLAGPGAAAQWMGLQNGIGNLAGIVGPYFTGLLVRSTGTFFMGFLVACASAVACACAYLFVVRKVEPVEWENG
jgi:cyanate permease